MRRVSLALVVYLIWGERNKRVFDNIVKSVDYLLRKFQILFYTVLYFHESNPLAYSVSGWALKCLYMGFGYLYSSLFESLLSSSFFALYLLLLWIFLITSSCDVSLLV